MGDNRRRVSFEGSEREERGAGWLLEAFRVSHLHSTIFSSLSIEGLHADILFTANLFGGLITVGLADDSDDVFGLMFLLFHVLV